MTVTSGQLSKSQHETLYDKVPDRAETGKHGEADVNKQLIKRTCDMLKAADSSIFP